MKQLISTLILTIIILISSCIKIIDIELDEADKKTSIDAQIQLGKNNVTARITKSGNFFGANSNPELTDATVVLNDGTSDFPLINMGSGNYELPGFTALSSQEYSMKVTQGGKTYDATTFIPNKVTLDTVLTTLESSSAFNDSGYIISVVFQDPPASANYYRIEVDIAGEWYGAIDNLILRDDVVTNGKLIDLPLFGADVAHLGDTVTVYLRSINKQSFKYFTAINDILSGGSTTPSNPKSNFNNNALGNFSAFATDTMTIVVQ